MTAKAFSFVYSLAAIVYLVAAFFANSALFLVYGAVFSVVAILFVATVRNRRYHATYVDPLAALDSMPLSWADPEHPAYEPNPDVRALIAQGWPVAQARDMVRVEGGDPDEGPPTRIPLSESRVREYEAWLRARENPRSAIFVRQANDNVVRYGRPVRQCPGRCCVAWVPAGEGQGIGLPPDYPRGGKAADAYGCTWERLGAGWHLRSASAVENPSGEPLAPPAPGTTRTVRFEFDDVEKAKRELRDVMRQVRGYDRRPRRGTYRIEVTDRHGKSHWGSPYVTREDALAEMPTAVASVNAGRAASGIAEPAYLQIVRLDADGKWTPC